MFSKRPFVYSTTCSLIFISTRRYRIKSSYVIIPSCVSPTAQADRRRLRCSIIDGGSNLRCTLAIEDSASDLYAKTQNESGQLTPRARQRNHLNSAFRYLRRLSPAAPFWTLLLLCTSLPQLRPPTLRALYQLRHSPAGSCVQANRSCVNHTP